MVLIKRNYNTCSTEKRTTTFKRRVNYVRRSREWISVEVVKTPEKRWIFSQKKTKIPKNIVDNILNQTFFFFFQIFLWLCVFLKRSMSRATGCPCTCLLSNYVHRNCNEKFARKTQKPKYSSFPNRIVKKPSTDNRSLNLRQSCLKAFGYSNMSPEENLFSTQTK